MSARIFLKAEKKTLSVPFHLLLLVCRHPTMTYAITCLQTCWNDVSHNESTMNDRAAGVMPLGRWKKGSLLTWIGVFPTHS